jgi:hypothetical protein
MIVDLTQEEVRVCVALATERWFTKFGSIDRPNYAKGKEEGRLEHDLNAGIRANVCEYAVAREFNVAWTTPWYPNALHGKRKDIADVGVNGEVRSVRTIEGIPFWEKDKGRTIIGAKVLESAYYNKVEIYKPFKADDYYLEEYRDESIQGWRVPISLLKDDPNG